MLHAGLRTHLAMQPQHKAAAPHTPHACGPTASSSLQRWRWGGWPTTATSSQRRLCRMRSCRSWCAPMRACGCMALRTKRERSGPRSLRKGCHAHAASRWFGGRTQLPCAAYESAMRLCPMHVAAVGPSMPAQTCCHDPGLLAQRTEPLLQEGGRLLPARGRQALAGARAGGHRLRGTRQPGHLSGGV